MGGLLRLLCLDRFCELPLPGASRPAAKPEGGQAEGDDSGCPGQWAPAEARLLRDAGHGLEADSAGSSKTEPWLGCMSAFKAARWVAARGLLGDPAFYLGKRQLRSGCDRASRWGYLALGWRSAPR